MRGEPNSRAPMEQTDADHRRPRSAHGGCENLTRPDFIGATSFSLLQRLRDAKAKALKGAQFTFVTVDRVLDDDPLRLLISGADRSVLADKLYDGTKTDASRMVKVRKRWREHLGLNNDFELREVLSGFRIPDGHRSLDEMRSEVNLRLRSVDMLTCSTNSDFRYDELARQLRTRGIASLTRDALRKLCVEEGLLDDRRPAPDDHRLIAIRSFAGTSADLAAVPLADTLLLSDAFNDRYLKDGVEWGATSSPGPRPSSATSWPPIGSCAC